ncbi:hypothetical protein EST92_11665 [Streptomyces sp. TM32]|uniref:hypothetical protein n=1 Tax=Streptomyces sp. TM32 TaxID=1652669 RepID=UPI00101199F4|nr:hypothetical protein [Streptomyces sp. TM32]RXS84208.1 hypothetical protein EST92_11665 [Streptomyces sp. TM32]
MRIDLTDERLNALHWAAVAIDLKASRERRDMPLTSDELAVHERYQANARSHGFTDADVRDYHAQLTAV